MQQQMISKTLLATCIAVASSQSFAASTRIIGGSEAQANAYPWMVSIQSNNGQHFCGGSLINQQWVLTAAHCIEEEKAAQVKVVVGDYDVSTTSEGGQARGVSSIIIHPQRGKGSNGDDNDIALMKLKSPVTGSPVLAATHNVMDGVQPGTLLTVMGWGNLRTTGEKFPDILNEVQVPMVSNAQCNQNYGGDITGNMICAGFTQGGKDSCQGDSGGPLLFQLDGQWHQVGIVSFGQGCAEPNFPGVYARVANYGSWITQQTGSDTGGGDTGGGDTGGGDTGGGGTGGGDTSGGTELTGLEALNLPEFIDLFSLDGEKEKVKVTLKNVASTKITIKNIRSNKPKRFKISGQNKCKTLLPGKSCNINLTYLPHPNNDFSMGKLIINPAGSPKVRVQLYGENLVSYDDNFDWDDGFDWYSDDAGWLTENDEFYLYGAYARKGERSVMSTRVEGPGTLSFNMQLPDDMAENSVTYLVDGKPVRTVSGGRKDIVKHSTELSAGSHQVSWVYNKRKETSGQVKVSKLRFQKSDPMTSGGGGSNDLFFLSGLLLMLGGVRKFLSRKV